MHRPKFNNVALVNSLVFLGTEYFAFKGLAAIQLPPFLAKGGHYQFLTNIALSISYGYFIVNAIYHLLRVAWLEKPKQYLSALCLSLNTVVTTVYWGLKLTLTHLILTEGEARIPLYLDVLIHIFPLAFVATDYLLFMDRWPISYMEAYSIIASCACMYWFWLGYVLEGQEAYPYPFLNVETTHRIVIFFLVSLVAFTAFCAGKLLHPEFIGELEQAEQKFQDKMD